MPEREPKEALTQTERTLLSQEMMKALVNPLRMSILDAVFARGYARAADIASDLNLASNKVSFHLRVLARAGLLREAPERARDKRDRVWTPTSEQFGMDPQGDPTLTKALMRHMADEYLSVFNRVLTAQAEERAGSAQGDETNGGKQNGQEQYGAYSRFRLRLTRDEYSAVCDRLNAVLDDARGKHPEDDADVLTWDFHIVVANDPSVAPSTSAEQDS